MIYDVVVVGAGPAGSTAARECASAGLKVVVADKAEFPRDKPCGGGVTIRASKLLPFDIPPVVERTIYGVRFTARPLTNFTRRAYEPLTFLTQRRHLDSFLLDQAERAGVQVRQRFSVRQVEQNGKTVTVRAGSEALEGRLVIAADGSNGMTPRLAGVPAPRWRGVALEGNASIEGKFPDPWRDVMGVDFSHMEGGYGWLFPKGDHVNIGVGGWHGAGPTLRRRLADLSRDYGFPFDSLWGLRGHTLPVRKPGAPLVGSRVALVGDAAGFLDPFTGEGIFAAMWSGRAAARRALEFLTGDASALDAYADDVETELVPDLRVSRKLYDLFHLQPWLWTQGVRAPGIWGLACRLLTGDQTYSGASRGSGWASSGLSLVYEGLKLASQTAPPQARPQTIRRPLFFAA